MESKSRERRSRSRERVSPSSGPRAEGSSMRENSRIYSTEHSMGSIQLIENQSSLPANLSEAAYNARSSELEYRGNRFWQILTKEHSLGQLVKENLAPRLNLVWDIDNTLIHAQEYHPVYHSEFLKLEENRVITVNGTRFLLTIRFGAIELLREMATFCNMFVYSKGVRVYIDAILNELDPDN